MKPWLWKGSRMMKQFEITSCLPNLQGEQSTTVRGILRVQPFTPKSLTVRFFGLPEQKLP